MPPLTHKRLLELFSYDPLTGIFIRRKARSGHAKGEVAGGDNGSGYSRITIDGKKYIASRLAWFYVHGQWPADHIDHENRQRSENRLENLRAATRSQNNANSTLQKRNKIGAKYVYPTATGYRVQIKKDHVVHQIGRYRSLLDAIIAARDAGVRLHGEFANLA